MHVEQLRGLHVTYSHPVLTVAPILTPSCLLHPEIATYLVYKRHPIRTLLHL